jgi:DNA-binding response OmpR family regulator
MNPEKREQIRRTLKNMAQANATIIELAEHALSLFDEELAIDPITFWRSHRPAQERHQDRQVVSNLLAVDQETLSINFKGRSCFVGNGLPFRLLSRLVRRPNAYLTYEDLLSNVWESTVSDSAVRSVVKRLRSMLRHAGMGELADAIDGSVPGHYALKLAN